MRLAKDKSAKKEKEKEGNITKFRNFKFRMSKTYLSGHNFNTLPLTYI